MKLQFPLPQAPVLQNYDYAQSGAYFVTVCTCNRANLFGEIQGGEMVLSHMGEIAMQRWIALDEHHPHIELDACVVMPNHLHGIIVFSGTLPATRSSAEAPAAPSNRAQPGSLGAIIASYKSSVTRHARQIYHDPRLNIWQGRYFDHVIHDERDLETMRHSITGNPERWEKDPFFA